MIMKKLTTLILGLAVALGVSAKPHTNLLDKLPGEGYTGYVNVELQTPGAFGAGGTNFGLTTVHGLMLTPRAFVGLGAGYLADFSADQGVIPIFAEGRLFFPSQYMRRIYPHIGARVGAQIATQGGTGALVQVVGGIRVPLSEKLALNVEIGPQYASGYERSLSSNQINYGGPFKSKGMKFSFVARVGIEF